MVGEPQRTEGDYRGNAEQRRSVLIATGVGDGEDVVAHFGSALERQQLLVLPLPQQRVDDAEGEPNLGGDFASGGGAFLQEVFQAEALDVFFGEATV